MNRVEYSCPSLRLGGAVALIGVAFLVAGYAMVWSSRTGKLRLHPGALGGEGNTAWICPKCFARQRDEFDWKVSEAEPDPPVKPTL